MKVNFHCQKGYLYEDHGAWYVQYRQRISQADGSSQLTHISKHLGRSNDVSNIFEVSSVGDASRMLRAIAKERDLTKTTLQHIQRGQGRGGG